MPKPPAGSFNIGWRKWQKQIMLALLTTIVAMLSVFTIPQNTRAVDEPTYDQAIIDDSMSTDSDDSADEASGAESETEPEKEANNCYDQVGALSWLVCPGTGVLAKAIDNIYAGIVYFLNVAPLSTDVNSPIYLIWEYARNITNVVFIIAILIIIYSQITGLGISNYGIKTVLPRIVVIAIAINLSYIATAIAIDASNIIGHSLRGVFTSVQEAAIAGGTINPVTANLSVGDLVAGFVGTGSITYAGVALAGGAGLVFWALVPIVFAGFVAVITGLLTLVARQALISILVMTAPLALIAYLFPNTESLFRKWKDLLLRMLIVFPAISMLFGASQLAGWAIIASAANAFGILLGIAVQIFPLFFSFQIMKMSGSIMGKFSEAVRKPFAPAQRALSAYSATRADQARKNYVANSNSGGAALRRYLAKRAKYREDRAGDSDAFINSRAATYSATKRGRANSEAFRRHKLAETSKLEAETASNVLKSRTSNYGKFSDQTTTDQAIAADAATTYENYMSSLERLKMDDREDRLHYATQVEKAHRAGAGSTNFERIVMNATGGRRDSKSLNSVIASAIAIKQKADSEAKSDYLTQFNDAAFTEDVTSKFGASVRSQNYNEMDAIIETLALRGDFDQLDNLLRKYVTYENFGGNIAMQKHLSDVLLKYKADSAPIATFAKSLNMRRGKFAAGQNVAMFTSYKDFITGAAVGNEDPNQAAQLSLTSLLSQINDPAIAVTQDRTTYKYLLNMVRSGEVSPGNLGFQVKQLRSAATSGRLDGEALANLNSLLTGGYKRDLSGDDLDFFTTNRGAIEQNLKTFVSPMSASQLASMKESTFLAINDALNAMQGLPPAAIDSDADGNVTARNINTQIKTWLATARNQIEKPSAAGLRGSMNTNIAAALDIDLNA